MKINELFIRDFRNIERMSLQADDGINVIYGENAQGKTNIIEAMWLFSGLKSFRGAKDSETVKFGSQFAVLKMNYRNSVREMNSEIIIMDRRQAKLNGIDLSSPTGLIGKFSAVVFAPSFLSIIKDGPGERRKFVDAALCQLKPGYASVLSDYNRVLKQRNALLKDLKFDSALVDMLSLTDVKLGEIGDMIVGMRKHYLDSLRPVVSEIYTGLSSGREEISFNYIQKGSGGEIRPLNCLLHEKRKEDIFNKTSTVGPHRDDIEICINGISARAFGSQGQQRSCALALKLGESGVMEKVTGEQPVILLDDVMSELDYLRQDYILNRIRDRQVFITCCEPSKVLETFSGRTVNITQGRINQCT